MGKLSRDKGARGEREALHLLKRELGQVAENVQRNYLEQSAHGGCDLVGLPPFAIEIKRAKAYSAKWSVQAAEQAARVSDSAIPVVMYRLDRHDWRVEIPGRYLIDELANENEIITMSATAFCTIVRERLSCSGA